MNVDWTSSIIRRDGSNKTLCNLNVNERFLTLREGKGFQVCYKIIPKFYWLCHATKLYCIMFKLKKLTVKICNLGVQFRTSLWELGTVGLNSLYLKTKQNKTTRKSLLLVRIQTDGNIPSQQWVHIKHPDV